MCYAMVFIFLMVYIYTNYQSDSQLIYQSDQELKIILSQADTVSQPAKVHNEAEQKVKSPNKPDENKISSPTQKKENQNSNQDTNQQKVVKLPDKPDNVIENMLPSQKKASDRPHQVNQNQTDLGINATHINGMLMEPIKANYTRNIYFTVKTTHRFYTERLFPIMLTWLQLMDKNKVSCYYSSYIGILTTAI